MILAYFKQQWHIFSDREKRLTVIGGITIIVLFVYFVLWCPLSGLVDRDKTQFQSQKKLLSYLQNASHEIQVIKASGIQVNNHEDGNLLALVEQTLSQEKLSSYLKQVQQLHQNKITLTFDRVPFQQLLQWLQKLIAMHDVQIQQFNAHRLSVDGTASVVIVIRFS